MPTLGLQLACWALGRLTAAAARRSQGSGAREFGLQHGGCLPEAPEPQSQLGAIAPVLLDTEAEGAGLGLERDCTRGESGSSP